MLAIAALLLLTAAAPPLEEDIPFQEGRRLYGEFEYERAIFRFKDALKDETRSPADRATIAVWLGMTYAQLGDTSSAERSFDEAIGLDPAVAIPPTASPKVKEMLDAARARAAQKQAAADPPVDEEPKEQVVVPPPAPPPAPAKGFPVFLASGGASAAAGVAAVAGGAALGALAAGADADARSARFQSDAARLVGERDGLALGANVLFGVGAGLAGLGAAIAVASFATGEL